MNWILTLLACSKTVPPQTPAPPAATTPPVSVSMLVHMDDHLYRASAIRDAVVLGHFEDARADFQWMAEHQTEAAMPAGLDAWVARMRDSASAGAAAESVQGQAAALGQLAGACGGCHQAMGTGPSLEEPIAPVLGDSQGVHMAQHSWASGRMWAALIEPSPDAWERALDVLSEDAVPAEEVTDWGLQEGTQPLDEVVHRLAHAEREGDTLDERAEMYGQIVAACATCHQAARGESPQ